MSQENVEVVRQHIEAYAAGDGERALSFVDPEVVVDFSRMGSREGSGTVMPAWLGRYGASEVPFSTIASRFVGWSTPMKWLWNWFARPVGGGPAESRPSIPSASSIW